MRYECVHWTGHVIAAIFSPIRERCDVLVVGEKAHSCQTEISYKILSSNPIRIQMLAKGKWPNALYSRLE